MCILLAENRPRGRGPTIEVRSVIAPEVKIRGSVGRSSTLRRSGRGPKRAMVSRGTIIGWRRRSNGPAKWPRNKMVRNGGYLVRARVRRRSGDRRGARSDVETGLALGPGDPRLLELRGLLEAESGHPGAALIDLNRAILRGAQGTVRVPRAVTLMALGRDEEAIEDWSSALGDDPEDPRI